MRYLRSEFYHEKGKMHYSKKTFLRFLSITNKKIQKSLYKQQKNCYNKRGDL